MHPMIRAIPQGSGEPRTEAQKERDLLAELEGSFRKRRRARRILTVLRWLSARHRTRTEAHPPPVPRQAMPG